MTINQQRQIHNNRDFNTLWGYYQIQRNHSGKKTEINELEIIQKKKQNNIAKESDDTKADCLNFDFDKKSNLFLIYLTCIHMVGNP